MSITTEFLKLRMGGIRGGQAIIDAKDRLKLLWTLAMLAKIQPLLVRMPYRTGNMYSAILGRLMSSPAGKVDIGAPGIPYAGYVNEMRPPINWTRTVNANPTYQWFEWLLKQGEKFAMPTLREKIREVGLEKLTGMSVNELAGMIYE